MYHSSRAVGSLLVILSVAVGCSRKRVSPTPVSPVDRTAGDDGAQRDSIARAEAARRDSLAREASLREARERRLAEARATLAAPVYFAYDRSDLSPEARGKLDAKAQILNGSPALRLRLEGHTDERGSDEYNLALGQRRAASALQYLTALGIPAARLDITSFGEEKPVCEESVESCWSRNRRVEFEIVAGADLIVVR
jgi:peptidoglycan-associated lipoprotein